MKPPFTLSYDEGSDVLYITSERRPDAERIALAIVKAVNVAREMGAKLEAERAENTRLREVVSEYARGVRK